MGLWLVLSTDCGRSPRRGRRTHHTVRSVSPEVFPVYLVTSHEAKDVPEKKLASCSDDATSDIS